jgi:hypothetical protein
MLDAVIVELQSAGTQQLLIPTANDNLPAV